MFLVRLDKDLRDRVREFYRRHWGAPVMVSKGSVHHIDHLSGVVALSEDDEIIGLMTYSVREGECEIVSLNSLREKRGIGTRLLEKVVEEARQLGLKRVWLITTNDNTRALRFYQKRGFEICQFYRNAVIEARKIKPEIPETGYDGIPILHEIELEKKIDSSEKERDTN
ncbi:MAG: GNAT family N-acetyltransferase [Bacillaceae bacterium]|nr:GNAT family N-acetyltransferase [Bacillaceae bacterium]